jgi:CRP/FNR family transcriptional regulator, cyclic AMP receptor protein
VVLAFLRFYSSSFPQEVAFCAFLTLEKGPIMPLVAASKKLIKFDPKTFISTINGGGRRIVAFSKKQTIFIQGDSSDAVSYVQKGKSETHRCVEDREGSHNRHSKRGQAKVALLGRLSASVLSTAMTDCSLMRIDKNSMVEVLHRESAFSEMFVAYLLARNIRYEEDLVDELFNSSEKRLARILLLLAHFGKEGVPETLIANISQETLAEMIGTTRSRASFFVNWFRKLGFIDYHAGDDLQVHRSLLNAVLHD